MWWQLRAAGYLFSGAIRGMAQYRADVVFTVLAGMFYQVTTFLAVWVILARFQAVAGWGIKEIALLYGMRVFSHGLWVLPLNQMHQLSRYVQEGTFDRFLVRPVNPLVQLMFTRVRFNALGDLLGGVTLMIAGLCMVHIDWTVWKVIYLVLGVIAGAMVEAGIQLALSSLSFRFVKAARARYTVDDLFNMFGNYPARMFGSVGMWTLTLIPVTFVAYLPATVLLDRVGAEGIPSIIAYLSPIVGPMVFISGYAIWMSRLRDYSSTGN
ncbi:MAG TPA: ABC-2 family transporter protein [Stackebrandtia sp.]|jgi:ABC-2 type transport system permease protein|uniref:ABC transporter permease n=1 Tax=Stackebrandtia sp. TaxID=2023065 RepID=UPI002D4239D1|nr:ABC-2 family transporter protein [Stackebrandtia sp.]HZE40326.1 ABC-2 family transporter protein [Stackebrandtia sp.]